MFIINNKNNSLPEQVQENMRNIKSLANKFTTSESLTRTSTGVEITTTNVPHNTQYGLLFDEAGNIFEINGTSDTYVFITYLTNTKGLQGEQGEPGPTGAQGLQGPAGPAGPTGPQGVKGEQGLTGQQGLQGEQGIGIKDIIVNPQNVTESGNTYVVEVELTNGQSITAGDFEAPIGPTGPQGAQGIQGKQGPTGPQGVQGLVGPAGPQGLVGPQGPAGPQGIQGPKGDTGASGNDFTVIGTVDSIDELPAGKAGDAYFVGSVPPRLIYAYDGITNTWVNQGYLQGEKGEPGPVGPEGPQGLVGPAGPAGPAGPQGVQGLQGEQGEQGQQGEQGPAGPRGLTGEQGPAGPQGASVTNVKVTPYTTTEAGSYYKIDFELSDGTQITGQQFLAPAGPQGNTGPQGPAGVNVKLYRHSLVLTDSFSDSIICCNIINTSAEKITRSNISIKGRETANGIYNKKLVIGIYDNGAGARVDCVDFSTIARTNYRIDISTAVFNDTITEIF